MLLKHSQPQGPTSRFPVEGCRLVSHRQTRPEWQTRGPTLEPELGAPVPETRLPPSRGVKRQPQALAANRARRLCIAAAQGF